MIPFSCLIRNRALSNYAAIDQLRTVFLLKPVVFCLHGQLFNVDCFLIFLYLEQVLVI